MKRAHAASAKLHKDVPSGGPGRDHPQAALCRRTRAGSFLRFAFIRAARVQARRYRGPQDIRLLQASREIEAARYAAASVFSRDPFGKSQQDDSALRAARVQRTRGKRLPFFHDNICMMNLDAAFGLRASQFDQNVVCARVAAMSPTAKAESGRTSDALMLISGVDSVHDEITFEDCEIRLSALFCGLGYLLSALRASCH
ncbi:hypothetical protein [Paraburkholderia caribensis]|uniref:hypothetical protein n=1 Tax=Paraburkholderia caribensis TaxID=75105 RepID=UPI001CC3F2D4|nr:hypothetical protein [Paraburkholderia caribensis]